MEDDMLQKLTIVSLICLASAMGLSACTQNRDAKVVSDNLSHSADNFEVDRRTVFYNGMTGEYLLNVEGKCSITKDNTDNQLELLCKVGPNEYKKHILGISDNVTYFSEQLTAKTESAYHYKVEFKPQSLVPDVRVKIKQEGQL
jgi:hypothetical protein